jgi:hypothetical protein
MASSAAHLYHNEVQQRRQRLDRGRQDVDGSSGQEWEEMKRVEQEGWEELDFFTG